MQKCQGLRNDRGNHHYSACPHVTCSLFLYAQLLDSYTIISTTITSARLIAEIAKIQHVDTLWKPSELFRLLISVPNLMWFLTICKWNRVAVTCPRYRIRCSGMLCPQLDLNPHHPSERWTLIQLVFIVPLLEAEQTNSSSRARQWTLLAGSC